jgi:DNA-binding SARP family transcriptional activator/predicted ATPase
MLSFTLLGPVVLSKNGVPVTQFRSQKEAALLIYLAQTGQAHPRDFIADLLWESSSTSQALSNLRTALTRLRKQVGDGLRVTRKTVALAAGNLTQVDSVSLLQRLAAVGQIDTAEKAATLQQTLDAYDGDFLADFHLADAPQFNEWVLVTREHIRRQVISAYDKLGQYALSTGDADTGIAAARGWLQVDGLDEAAHTLLIRLLLAAGNVREATAHYDHCVALLRAELDVAPPAAMTALIADVQPRRTIEMRPTTAPRHNLPPEYDQFFGRETVQAQIHARLDQPWCRLVTITGLGGVGKTRLAATIARRRLDQYADGVWLVELADMDPNDDDLTEAIAVEIASVLDLRLTGSTTPLAQLLTHLRHKQMLLVLDNFELLFGGMQIVLDIVGQCENVQLLVTSREALQIRAEWTIALGGLSWQTSDRDDRSSEAVDLFVARQMQLGSAQSAWGAILRDDLSAVRTICHTVEGLPLAIELAAALTQEATAWEIAAELRHGFDALTTSLRDMPQRHRGLHVVFEMSWRTLTPALQQRLARLSVFRSGFTGNAAWEIAEADAQDLDLLCAKSLLSYNGTTERYTLHPVINAYAAQRQLPTDPTQQKHAHYYLALLAAQREPLQKEAPQHAVALLQPDMDNVRLAWQTGLAQGSGLRLAADLLSAALPSLSIYYQLRGLAREGEAVMQSTVSAAQRWGAEGRGLATRAGLERARFQNRLGHYRPAIQTVNAALALAAQGGDPWAEGMGHVLWGESLWRLGEYDASASKLTHALKIGQAIESTLIIGWCHHHLGVINDIQSHYDAALDHLQQACTAWRAIDNAQALSNSLNSIGLVHYNQGDLSGAQQAMEETLALCSQLDNRPLQSLLLNNLGLVSTDQGDYFSAHHYLQIGLELAKANGDLAAQGLAHLNLGKNYRLLNEPDLEVDNLQEGLRISESIGDSSMIATALFYLAVTRHRQRDAKRAEALYGRALQIARHDNLQHIVCEVLINMAEFLNENNERAARQYSAEAVALARAIQNPRLLERASAIDRYLTISISINEKSLYE